MDEILNRLGMCIDGAAERRDRAGLDLLLVECNQKLVTAVGVNKSILFFFKANCYSAIEALEESSSGWENNQRLAEVLSLRQAVSEEKFNDLPSVFRAKIYTNLGNNLNYLGRFVDALSCWNSALQIIPNFAMALGNKGVGLYQYGCSLYDHGHTGIFIAEADISLTKALAESALWESGPDSHAKSYFKKYKAQALKVLKDIEYDHGFDLDQWSLGRTKKERVFRKWALTNKLFLSPLNDFSNLSAAAQDVIHLPSHRYDIRETLRFPNYFNLLKQEYITARLMLFEAVHETRKHYSDNDTLMLNGYDGVYFGYRSEQLKIAYRLSYSLFDKIASFINDYFCMGLKPGQVSFKKIWGTTKNDIFTLSSIFKSSNNWPLRGLYFLSKDLFDESFLESSLPDAQELAEIRNFAEHRFLSIQELPFHVTSTEVHSYITIDDFQYKVKRILSMAREALIYLSLSMHSEELRRQVDDDDQMIFSVPSEPID